MCTRTLVVLGLWLTAGAAQGATLSANLIGGGDFEDFGTESFVGDSGTVVDYKYFKHEHSPRTQAEIDAGANPVRAWQFHPNYDLGRWITVYGAGSNDYGLMTGISTYAQPRTLWNEGTSAWQPGSAVSCHNVSVDPSNPANHVMESVMFRSSLGIFLKAPTNQVIGPAQLDFDYFVHDWTVNSAYYNYQPYQVPVILHMWVYGVEAQGLPTWQMRWGPGLKNPGELPSGLSGWHELYATPHWSDWWDEDAANGYPIGHDGFVNIDGQGYDSLQWRTLSNGVTAPLPPPPYNGAARTTDGSFVLDKTYPYYYVDIWFTTYSEPSPYFWQFGQRPTDVFSDAFDNISLKVTTALLGDVNLDTLVNALDISPFVQRLTGGTYQVEADINQDGLVNALDISGFVTCLVNGGCAGESGGSAVPEPASLAGVLLLAAALCRCRRWPRATPSP